MKFMIASDLHGSAYYTRQLLDTFQKEGADRLLLLGDILYHGPRNDLPREYAPKEVIALLSEYKDKILCVRGNCDTEVDQMVLDFPILADYALIPVGRHLMFVTHGHHWNEEQVPPLSDGDILLNGHFHVPACRKHGTYVYLNPGSVSLPKEDSWHGYMILQGNTFVWKDLDGTEKMRYTVED